MYADQTPEQKLDVVRALQARPELRSIVMVGDGINDAPALALADVGVAMGSGGATVSSETADAVVLVDRVDRVADAISFSRRALSIARQSVLLGIGASLVAMGFAALRLPPARRRRASPGRDRRRRDPERPARARRLMRESGAPDSAPAMVAWPPPIPSTRRRLLTGLSPASGIPEQRDRRTAVRAPGLGAPSPQGATAPDAGRTAPGRTGLGAERRAGRVASARGAQR